MSSVTVYSRRGCVQCDATERALRGAGVAHRVVDVDEYPAARDFVEELGYLSVPVVVVDDDLEHHWWGFRPDRIQAVAAASGAGQAPACP